MIYHIHWQSTYSTHSNSNGDGKESVETQYSVPTRKAQEGDERLTNDPALSNHLQCVETLVPRSRGVAHARTFVQVTSIAYRQAYFQSFDILYASDLSAALDLFIRNSPISVLVGSVGKMQKNPNEDDISLMTTFA